MIVNNDPRSAMMRTTTRFMNIMMVVLMMTVVMTMVMMTMR